MLPSSQSPVKLHFTGLFISGLFMQTFSSLYITRMKRFAPTDPALYERWKVSHKCNLNFSGSSPAMEKAGAVKISSSSKTKHKLLYYTSFYGDGDSKSFSSVKDVFECIRHYQKRVGSRLRNLKKIQKALKEEEGSQMPR